MNRIFLGLTIVIVVLSVAAPARAEDHRTYDLNSRASTTCEPLPFGSQGSDVSMAYMDVKPQTTNGRTAVLLHGTNFCPATWEKTIKVEAWSTATRAVTSGGRTLSWYACG
jgi:hypothetical protein